MVNEVTEVEWGCLGDICRMRILKSLSILNFSLHLKCITFSIYYFLECVQTILCLQLGYIIRNTLIYLILNILLECCCVLDAMLLNAWFTDLLWILLSNCMPVLCKDRKRNKMFYKCSGRGKHWCYGRTASHSLCRAVIKESFLKEVRLEQNPKRWVGIARQRRQRKGSYHHAVSPLTVSGADWKPDRVMVGWRMNRSEKVDSS